jgi:hypothetical protein
MLIVLVPLAFGCPSVIVRAGDSAQVPARARSRAASRQNASGPHL